MLFLSIISFSLLRNAENQIQTYANFLPLTLTLTLIISYLFYKKYGLLKKISVFRKTKYTTLLLSILFYSLSISIITNNVFDYKDPEVYTVKILDKKRESSGKGGTTYRVITTSWDNQDVEKNLYVGDRDYSSFQIGQDLSIFKHQGFLDLSWISY